MLEASGGLELPLVAALARGSAGVVVNPRQVRDFAKLGSWRRRTRLTQRSVRETMEVTSVRLV